VNNQLVRVVVAYIDQRPARLHESFLNLALEALTDAWPCQKVSNAAEGRELYTAASAVFLPPERPSPQKTADGASAVQFAGVAGKPAASRRGALFATMVKGCRLGTATIRTAIIAVAITVRSG
jgi:hypothetical protein